MSARLATLRRGIYFWVLAHLPEPAADDIDPAWERHGGLLRARGAVQQPRGDVNGAGGHVETCRRCGKPARGWANIHGQRYCHTYDQGFPDCYTLALHEGVHRRTTGTTKGAETT